MKCYTEERNMIIVLDIVWSPLLKHDVYRGSYVVLKNRRFMVGFSYESVKQHTNTNSNNWHCEGYC